MFVGRKSVLKKRSWPLQRKLNDLRICLADSIQYKINVTISIFKYVISV